MPAFDTSLTFFLTALFLAAVPGPDNIFVLTQSALFNARAGIATTFGLVTGICFHTLAVAIGIAALLLAYPWSLRIIKSLGALYLCWLAWLSLKAGKSDSTKSDKSRPGFPGYLPLYRRGIIMNITNPKVSLFFLAFLPQFCRQDAGSMSGQILYFGALFGIATIIVFCSIACAGGRLASWLGKSAKAQILLNRVAAVIFAALAAALFFTDI